MEWGDGFMRLQMCKFCPRVYKQKFNVDKNDGFYRELVIRDQVSVAQ